MNRLFAEKCIIKRCKPLLAIKDQLIWFRIWICIRAFYWLMFEMDTFISIL